MNHKLPIDEVLPELLSTLRSRTACVLQAPPGAGKTTRVPLALLDLIPPEAGRIVMLEPRRLAAVNAAGWMASFLGERVGETVGYSIRFDSRVSTSTRIEVVTEGILTRRIQSDPLLEGVAAVIFDEFHERSFQADLGLALCLDVQRQVRDDLRILVMSATLECEPLARLLGNAPVITSKGRTFPVEEVFLEDQPRGPLPPRMAAAIGRALAETGGDILAFLPGAGEIRSCALRLEEMGLPGRGIAVLPLYGDLPFDRQQAAIQPGPQRRVVLATSIAETSLTIEGIETVVDSGLSRRLRHDLSSGINRLVTVRESRASAEQRKGRAGRLAPGVCYRLFSRHTYSAMVPQTPAEILEMDLAPLVLELSAWGMTEPSQLSWLDPPPAAALAAARRLLSELSAVDEAGRITATGRAMAGLPLHPRLARLLVRSKEIGCPELGCDLAALLSERDIVRRGPAGLYASGHMPDIGERLRLLREWRSSGRGPSIADSGALAAVERVSRQLLKLQGNISRQPVGNEQDGPVSRLLLSAYPDRVGMLRANDGTRYLMANGRGARLADALSAIPEILLVAVAVDGGEQGEQGEGLIHLAAPVSEEVLRSELADRIERKDSVSWDSREGRVIAVRQECLGALQLSSRAFAPPAESLVPVIVEVVRASLLGLLTRADGFYQFQARVMMLRRMFPADGWPDLSDTALLDTLDIWLAPALGGIRTAQQLAAVDCTTALGTALDYRQRQALEQLAPTHLTVPSGSRIRIDYCAGELPVLAVKLQELFGLAETPTVAAGRVAVLLHLLSPAGRPLQVTGDLKGFWDGSYHQVKKEMKGRYPKHPWPDDPWSAPPTRRAKPRG
ncbi:ATP-dependent helicase HrpB [Geobacter sp. SVR]|uniref:ATP-dependent helicase HrpB n=1 Tax=Geobacter sp. SVR TaxID=2495594 RepID=UPI001564972A|nr:ATP-dependent helicase HrpB [Geobacter sp. SVR]